MGCADPDLLSALSDSLWEGLVSGKVPVLAACIVGALLHNCPQELPASSIGFGFGVVVVVVLTNRKMVLSQILKVSV